MQPLIHIAGPDVQVGARLRQRCCWCGAILLDYALDRIAVPEGQDPRPGTWPPRDLIAVDGTASYAVPHQEGDQLPPGTCVALDADVTV